ncbi:MAG: hypothetical protein E5V63_30135 [Mesorhizobium sp.]|nr:MAG: hypothetical protein E5V63_30135 [Mesorhizobium sp.]
MGGFGMILGGAMSGWSDARLDEIKAEREARLQELEAQRQDRRIADERKFRHDEAEIGRNYEAGENQKTRDAAAAQRADDRNFSSSERKASEAFTSGENEKERTYRSDEAQKNRESSGDLITDDKGNSYSRSGSKATPLTDDKGNPVKVAGGGKAQDKPAEVSTAEWLIQQGVADNPADAWKMVRSARADPEKSRASIYKAWLDALTKGAMGAPDAADLQKQAQEATEKTLQYLDEDAGGGAAQGGGASEAIPSDPAKRVVGKTYTNKNGQKAIWKGNGWELVQ